MRDIKKLTRHHGIDVYFDPVAAGAYLDTEIKTLAQHGTIWIYGLLGKADTVNVAPLIIKSASMRGWVLNELTYRNLSVAEKGYQYILDGFNQGVFRQRVARTFNLKDVRNAHEELQKGRHIGKFILTP